MYVLCIKTDYYLIIFIHRCSLYYKCFNKLTCSSSNLRHFWLS